MPMSTHEETHIRRREDGSIDVDFYMDIAASQRSLAIRDMVKAILRRIGGCRQCDADQCSVAGGIVAPRALTQ